MTQRILAALMLWIVPAANAFEYALDDGTGNFTIGPSQFDAEMLWGNYFDVEQGYETITSISVSFATALPLDRPVTVLLFDDPDDDLDPTNAVPVAQAVGTTVAAPVNAFVSFDIADTPITGGFFVGVLMDLAQHEAPARMDPDSQHGRSWLFFDGEIDLNNLASAPVVYNMADTPFNGNWMVRAVGVPEPGGISLLIGLSAATLVVRRRKRLGGRERE